jgi:hypothetical protein
VPRAGNADTRGPGEAVQEKTHSRVDASGCDLSVTHGTPLRSKLQCVRSYSTCSNARFTSQQRK